MSDATAEIIKILPSILWFFLGVAVLYMLYRPIREDLLPKIGSFEMGGVKLSFVRDSLNAAVELAEKSLKWQVVVSPEDKTRALSRAKKHLEIFRDAQFLWIDDHPENNLNERRMFRQLGAEIDVAKSTEEGLDILKHGSYNLVISDMARDGQATAGLQFLGQFREINKSTPVIFYVGVVAPEKGVPPRAFGITNRPDELLHLTLDALERQKH